MKTIPPFLLVKLRGSWTHLIAAFTRRGRVANMRALAQQNFWIPSLLVLVFCATTTSAMRVEHLHRESKLTPKKFSRMFAEFDYKLFDYVQAPNDFLRTQKGDCDDYACLADEVLRPKGFETRLVHIRLVGMISHAVCYITENGAYLDYNNRNVFFTMTRSDPSLRKIAAKVAHSLNANWTSAFEFEFSYADQRKTITAKVVRTQDPRTDPLPGKAAPRPNPFLVE